MRPSPYARRPTAHAEGWVVAVAILVALPTGVVIGISGHGDSRTGAPDLTAGSGPGRPHAFLPPQSSANDWPELHQTPLLTGYASHSYLSSVNASKLGVVWAADLESPALDSPVVAYDSTLHETLAYIGTESGDVMALNLANGQTVWATWLGSAIRSTPAVSNGSVWVGTFENPSIFRLNSSTGAIQCSVVAPGLLEGTPTVVTPKGGIPTVYLGSTGGSHGGPMLAVNAANCSIEWEFKNFPYPAGSWDAVSYAVNGNGTPIIIFGTADTDSAVYALNALTGKLVWRFQSFNPPPGVYDIGAGAVISPPGKNGFADGVAYVPSKYGFMYALDLNTGSALWSTNYYQLVGVANGTDGGTSTAALDGNNLVFGTPHGLINLNASTGQLFWLYTDPSATEAISSPAIAGGHGHGIIVVGDISGSVDVLAVVGGGPLYTYHTGGYITASPAESGGNILIASTDQFLYDFAVGGGNDAALPTTTISSPLPASTVANPNGNLTVYGNATDPLGVARVSVAIQSDGPAGRWWDAASSTWSLGPVNNPAHLVSPGGLSTAWTFAYPELRAGDTVQVTAWAASVSGQSDILGGHVGFAVNYSTSGPHLRTTPQFVPPGGNVTVNGGGFTQSEKVVISLLGKTLATVIAGHNGSIPAVRVKIPPKTLFGQTSLNASGRTSHKSATTALTIGNNWDQVGYDPGHEGYEPNDPTLNTLIFPGANQWVRLSWNFIAGAPVYASPVVADGVVYVGDSGGRVYAVDTSNGGLLWTWTLPSGAGINGSLAVDPSAGLVFAAAGDGTLTAISTSTGLAVWNRSLGGNLTAPVYADGEVFIASSSGLVEALSESNGSPTWNVSETSGISGAPALDSTAAQLVVGEANGAVLALNSTNGHPSWSYLTGGAVTAAAVVSGGIVYVGSADGKVYALNLGTGTKVWSFTTGGAVTDTGVLESKDTVDGALELLIGSDDGKMYAISAATGHMFYNLSFSAPIVGVAGMLGLAIFVTSTGIVSAM
ncbi:MAG: PQQ-binding-like beta-propeller repeat protein, partial [Thermoplasmata archaeon]|nr:PQQ-binding-like beta-propeller repeat protein [Thermoplasmata archaeon]